MALPTCRHMHLSIISVTVSVTAGPNRVTPRIPGRSPFDPLLCICFCFRSKSSMPWTAPPSWWKSLRRCPRSTRRRCCHSEPPALLPALALAWGSLLLPFMPASGCFNCVPPILLPHSLVLLTSALCRPGCVPSTPVQFASGTTPAAAPLPPHHPPRPDPPPAPPGCVPSPCAPPRASRWWPSCPSRTAARTSPPPAPSASTVPGGPTRTLSTARSRTRVSCSFFSAWLARLGGRSWLAGLTAWLVGWLGGRGWC